MRPAYRSLRYLPVLGVIVIWQIMSSSGVIPANRLPSPAAILRGFTELSAGGLPPGYTLAGHCAGSLKRVLSGVAIAVLTALPLGIGWMTLVAAEFTGVRKEGEGPCGP